MAPENKPTQETAEIKIGDKTILCPVVTGTESEKGIDISRNQPRSVDRFLSQQFDYVITVCDGANESCPAFSGSVSHRLHLGFEDPAKVVGSDGFVLDEFRRIRDEIERAFHGFAEKELS